MIAPSSLAIILRDAPFPGATFTVTPGDVALDLVVDGVTITFCEGAWFAAERRTTPAHLSFASTPTAEQVHTEIRRVLALLTDPPKPVRLARMEPGDLYGVLIVDPFPGAADLRLDKTGLHFTVGGVAVRFDGEAFYAPRYHVRSTLPHPSATNAQGVHAEIHRVLALVMGAGEPDALQDRLTNEIDRLTDVEAQLAQVTAERDAERIRWGDQIQDRDTRIRALEVERDRLLISEDTLSKIAAAIAIPALEPYDDALSMVKRLVDGYAVVSQRLVGAQKEVAERDATIDELRTALESIAANVGLVGSDQWAVGELVGKVGEATARADKAEDRLRRDDDLRSAIAIAVGLDGSASLALILDTVTRDRPGREISRLSGLLDVLAAPVAFGERRLSTAERAEWALRRWLAEGKECSARMAQLIEAEVMLDVLGVPAYAAVPSDDPGDASEALTLPERLRLHFGARS